MTELLGFLEPLDGPNASGSELRNDARFHGIERLLEPARRSNRVEAAQNGGMVQIDWGEVLEAARELAAHGRDLRLLVIVARALAAEGGPAGLADGLDLLTETVTRFWDTVHPVLRESPTPREAATRRINALYQIENADNGLLGDLEFQGFFSRRLIGAVTGGDLAAGRLGRATIISEAPSGLGQKELDALVAAHETRVGRVTAACRALAAEEPEEFAALRDGVARALQSLANLEVALDSRVADGGVGVRFKALGTFLGRVADTLGAVEAAGTEATQNAEAPMNGSPSPAALPAAHAASGAAPPPGIPGQISSRKDVERCLDMIIDFYERTEPSSPIPHLARRMRKMVPMNFLQLMEEIAPSGMKEFRSVAGVFEEKPK